MLLGRVEDASPDARPRRCDDALVMRQWGGVEKTVVQVVPRREAGHHAKPVIAPERGRLHPQPDAALRLPRLLGRQS